MKDLEFRRIKNKIILTDPTKYWGDDFDVRYYLISRLKNIRDQIILDVGGGIGIVTSEVDKNNLRVNLDASLTDLKTCKEKIDHSIENICASMTNLPFIENAFDCVICSNILEVAKHMDLEDNKIKKINNILEYTSVEATLNEMNRVLKFKGRLFVTTPNNSYYKTTKLSYNEIKYSLSNHFSDFSLKFYNTFPRLSRKYRKLNLANVIPKIMSKFISHKKILLKLLLKCDKGKDRQSVSFYVEATKS